MENSFELKSSGTEQQFSTGAVRDVQTGKGRFDLLNPIFLERLAKWMEKGANRYAARNWEKGIPLTRFLDSLLRHINKLHEGHRDEDHEAAIGFNAMGLLVTRELVKRGLLPAELDDLPKYLP